jgi:acetoacetyl-CoA synthetase
VIWLPYLKPDTELPVLPKLRTWSSLLEFEDVPYDQFKYERVAHDHPLWIVFSSGTTGLPKAIVHSHVGILAEHLKILCFHMNLGPQSTMFFYSTTGWMMWNLLQSALLVGSAVVLYDGSPTYPNSDFLWQLASATKVTCFGASPTFVQMMEKVGLKPNEKYDLSALESTVVSGAPSTPEIFDWFYRCVKKDLWVTSQSGGTEICSSFVGASLHYLYMQAKFKLVCWEWMCMHGVMKDKN